MRELLEVQQDSDNPREFMNNLKMALFPDEVYVFTPGGDVKSFPRGATPIDFAYSVHSDVGTQCIGAKINRNIVPLKYELRNGDTVEIITQTGHHPGKDWLKWAVTSKARTKIKTWIKTEERKKSIELGRDILERELRKHNLKLSTILKSEEIRKVFDEHKINDAEDLMALVGFGRVSAKHIANHFLPDEVKKKEEPPPEKVKHKESAPSTVGISLTGVEDVMVKFAKCCAPIPGDDIVGFISRGRGITIHTQQCPNILELDQERIVEVQWNVKKKQTFSVLMRVVCRDKKGVLAEVSAVIASMDVNITHAEVDTTPDLRAICTFKVEVHDLNQFNHMVSSIKGLKSVISVERSRQK
jgi:GTP pyrophosphokinase